jgi:transcriptional regulator with XRE-family HTH domain
MIKFNPKKIAERLSELNWDQTDLAVRMKKEGQTKESAQTYVNRVVLGRSTPGAGKIAQIAEVLNTDVNYFFDGIPEPKKEVVEVEKVIVQEPSPEKPTLEKVLKDLQVIVESKNRLSIFDNLDIHKGQRAVVVVIDDKGSQDNIFLDRAISLMQGVRQVVEVPANGEKQS